MALGCCCCKSYALADYVNVTSVPTYLSTGPATIPPYPRRGTTEGDPPSDCGDVDTVPCGAWGYLDRPFVAGSGQILHDQNLFEAGETTETITVCLTEGLKCAQSVKSWHGRLPFKVCTDGCTAISTRYRTVTVNITGWERDNDDICGSVFTYDEQRVFTVDRYSGEATLVSCTSNSRLRVYDSDTSSWIDVGPNTAVGFYSSWADVGCDGLSEPGKYAYWKSQTLTTLATLDVTSTKIEWHIESELVAPCLTPTQEYDAALIAKFDVIIELSDPYTAAEALSDAKDLLALADFRNDVHMMRRADNQRGLGIFIHRNETGFATPDLGFTGCEVDDYTNPTAGSGTEMDPYTAWTKRPWFDPVAYVWAVANGDGTYHQCNPALEVATDLLLVIDGSVIGEPISASAPYKRPDHMFGWDHKTWACWTPPDLPPQWEERKWGAYAGENSAGDPTDLLAQKNWSSWTDNYEAAFSWLGGSQIAWAGGADGAPTQVSLAKQNETSVGFRSYNNYGPCGWQRYEMDTTCSTNITGYTGTDDFVAGDTISTDDDLSGTLTTSDKVVIYGGTSAYKIFAIDSLPPNAIVLGAEDTDARNVADAFALWETTTPAIDLGPAAIGIIGKLRVWKRSGTVFEPPAICGKVAATGVAQDGSDVVITVATKYTKVGDKIDFVQGGSTDTANNDNGGSGFTLTAASDTELRFTGTYDSLTMKGYIKIHGAPESSLYSTARQRDFVHRSWPDDGAGGYGACVITDDHYTGTKVLGSTPNADTEANWQTDAYGTSGAPFPTATVKTCGAVAFRDVLQHMVDPLHLPPWSYAPFTYCAPQVEALTLTKLNARLASLSAPALPDGCTVELGAGGSPTTCGADCTSGQPNGFDVPWLNCSKL